MWSIAQYFPITNPTMIFLVVLMIILFAPIVMGKLRIPHIIGMVLAGMLVGKYGLNILERDDSFELFGRVGLLYIMFLAGLEMNISDMKENLRRFLVFGGLSFFVPFALTYAVSRWLLGLPQASTMLISCIMSSNTLIAYPIISRYGLQQHRSVALSVGATMVSLTLALLVLAAIVGAYNHETSAWFWPLFVLKVSLFCVGEVMLIPRLSRWFLHRYSDAVMQFVFVLAVLFLSAFCSELAGLEGIFGAFFSGLVMNRFIPSVSPLMNRIEFIGNALFIPYFLIGVGMMINIGALFNGWPTVWLIVCLVFFGTLGKAVAAYASCIGFRMQLREGHMMFGLTAAHAAGSIAMTLVGMNLELSPGVYLLNADVLNAVVCMILFTCIISSIVTERTAQSILLEEKTGKIEPEQEGNDEKILVAMEHPETADELMDIAILMRNDQLNRGLIGLNVVYDDIDSGRNQAVGRRILDTAAKKASAADVLMITQSRIATNISNGIAHAFKEFDASEIVMGLHRMTSADDNFWGKYTQDLVQRINRQIVMVRCKQPINTIRRIHVAAPSRSEFEPGFYRWAERVSRLAERLECRIIFHAKEPTLSLIKQFVNNRHPKARAEYEMMAHWDQLPSLAKSINDDHLLIVLTARKGTVSWRRGFDNMPAELTDNFATGNLIIIYPDQYGEPQDAMTFAAPQLNEQESAYYQLLKLLRIRK